MTKKNDILLILSLIIISLIFILVTQIIKNKQKDLVAYIYYKDELIQTIDLSKLNEEVEYVILGEIDEVILIAKHNAIMIKEANCPHQYCSVFGYSSSSSAPIICLPNKIYIKLVGITDVDLEI